MSRIDEALRRSGERRFMAGSATDAADPFESPWRFDGRSKEAGAVVAQLSTVSAVGPSIEGFAKPWAGRLVTAPGADPVVVEQFRRLAASLHHLQSNRSIRIVMVTSASAGEGKTLTTMNLALTLSESYGRNVLLVDADLRRPALHELARVPNLTGLNDVLAAENGRKVPVFSLSDRLTLAPAGPPTSDPMGALASERLRRILEEGSQRFDWVLVDAPPVMPIADAGLIVPNVDGVLLVVRAGHSRYEAVDRAIEELGRDNILGVVLNAASAVDEDKYAGYDVSYLSAADRG
jgi:non-specific protein-tyrosine kinase